MRNGNDDLRAFRNRGLSLLFALLVSFFSASGWASGIPLGNTPPVAEDDSFGTTQDQTLTFIEPGVLSNDTDANGDELTAVLATNVSNGVLTLNSDGSITYVPNEGFTGTDTFTYKADDGNDTSNAATVTITVSEVATAPVAQLTAAPSEGFVPLTVTFDASGSTDPTGGTIVAYNWFFGRNQGAPVRTSVPTITFTYNRAGNFDAGLFVGNDQGVPSSPVFIPIRVGDAIIDDPSLYISKGSFKINGTKHDKGIDADSFKISGHLNPRQFPDSLTDMTVAVRINGVSLADPVSVGTAVAVGDATVTASINSATGAYSYSIQNTDLTGILDLLGATTSGTIRLGIQVRLSGVTVPTEIFRGQFDYDYTAKEGKSATGTYLGKSHPALAGFFKSTKSAAAEQSDGGYKISLSGVILGDLSTALIPNGDITLTMGGSGSEGGVTITIPKASLNESGSGDSRKFSYSKSLGEIEEIQNFQIINSSRKFSLTTNSLAGTGIPASTETDLSYSFGAFLQIPTDVATFSFITIIELKRSSTSTTVWKR